MSDANSSPEPKSSRVASIDGLRGLLAVFVMTAHFANAYGYPALIMPAKSAVMIFFAISGYVLTRSWNGNYPSFLVKRFLRLWPAYAVVLFVGDDLAQANTPWTVFVWYPYLGIHDVVAANPVAWSLFVEAWATLLMPLVILIGQRKTTTFVAAIALLLIRDRYEDLYFGLYFILGSYCARYKFKVEFLETRLFQYLGRISYSLYLTHAIVIGVVKFRAPQLAPYLTIPLCLIAAQLCWFAVEQPSLWASKTLGRWLDRRMKVWRRPAPFSAL
jgi:peptidoglycan/LPS O-acetylase OafA/YrhL